MKYQLNEDWLDFKTAFARELAALGATGEETEAALDIAFANITECDDIARCAWDVLMYNVRTADENRRSVSVFSQPGSRPKEKEKEIETDEA